MRSPLSALAPALLFLAAPAQGRAADLRVTTEPSGARVLLDGVDRGLSPLKVTVAVGPHELRLSADGFTPRMASVALESDADFEVHAALSRLPAASPPGAPRPDGRYADEPQDPPPPSPADTPAASSPGLPGSPPIAPPAEATPLPPPPPAPALEQPLPLTPPPPPSAPPAAAAPGRGPATSSWPTASPPDSVPYVEPIDLSPREAPAPPPPGGRAPQLPSPVSELPTAWGTPRRTLSLVVETEPSDALVQVVGLPDARRAPATFTGFSRGRLQLIVLAPGYRERRVAVELEGDRRTKVVLERSP